MLALQISDADLGRISQELQATPTQFRAALRSALRVVSQRLRSLAARELSDEQKVKISQVRRRLKAMKVAIKGDGYVSAGLWLGTGGFGLERVGARQNKFGLKSPPVAVPHAFLLRGKGGAAVKRKGKQRLPLVRVKYDFKSPTDRWLARFSRAGELERIVMTEFERYLRWQKTST